MEESKDEDRVLGAVAERIAARIGDVPGHFDETTTPQVSPFDGDICATIFPSALALALRTASDPLRPLVEDLPTLDLGTLPLTKFASGDRTTALRMHGMVVRTIPLDGAERPMSRFALSRSKRAMWSTTTANLETIAAFITTKLSSLSPSFPVVVSIGRTADANLFIAQENAGKPLSACVFDLTPEQIDSLLAQFVIAVGVMNSAGGITHNDLHADNLLVRAVPPDEVLYYRMNISADSNLDDCADGRVDVGAGGGGAVHALPTHGVRLSIIDFGLCTVSVGRGTVGSATMFHVFDPIAASLPECDVLFGLITFINTFVPMIRDPNARTKYIQNHFGPLMFRMATDYRWLMTNLAPSSGTYPLSSVDPDRPSVILMNAIEIIGAVLPLYRQLPRYHLANTVHATRIKASTGVLGYRTLLFRLWKHMGIAPLTAVAVPPSATVYPVLDVRRRFVERTMADRICDEFVRRSHGTVDMGMFFDNKIESRDAIASGRGPWARTSKEGEVVAGEGDVAEAMRVLGFTRN